MHPGRGRLKRYVRSKAARVSPNGSVTWQHVNEVMAGILQGDDYMGEDPLVVECRELLSTEVCCLVYWTTDYLLPPPVWDPHRRS